MHPNRLFYVYLYVLACLSSAGIPAANAQPAGPPVDSAAVVARIDEYMQAQTANNGFSGSILLARDGKPLVSKGYGFANAEWQIPNTPDTKFRIGSITKQFTSMLVMQLRERGKIKLEDSLCLYVAPCPETWKPVTIHHLLNHTSGIPSYTGIAEWRKINMVPKTADNIIAFFRDLPLQWTPGEKYAYNNSGYFLLGVVIEKITGKKYEEALQEMILTPLGLEDTGYDWTSAIIPKRASGYVGTGAGLRNAPPLDMQQPYAAGALYSTVEDLLKWDQALYTDTLIPAAAKQIMWTAGLQDYGYGWTIREATPATFGHRRILHGGGINGFSAMIMRIPELKVTAIVLANNSTASASTVANDLLAIYFGQPYKTPRPATTVSAQVLEQYVGEYELRPGFILTISRDGQRLLAQATGQPQFELFAESNLKFVAKVVPIEVTFVKDATGAVTELILLQGEERRAKKIK